VGVFNGCTGLLSITVDPLNSFFRSTVDGVLFNKNQTTLIRCPGGKTGGYVITNIVTCIGDSAFSSCDKLTSISIPTNVTSIKDSAFSWCTSLASVTIPNSVTNIGDWAFGGCTELASVTLPNSVPTIGMAMFQYCNLTNITIPNSVTSIGAYAFRSCYNLSSVILGTNVTSIGKDAFALCINLPSIKFPSSVTNIGDAVFMGCNNLGAVYFKGNAPHLDSSDVFPPEATVYYLPKTTGWPTAPETFGGSEAVLWDPKVRNDSTFGVGPSGFGFTITGPTNVPIVVQACTDLVESAWFALATNTLTGGSSYFSDPQWTNDPARFYRFCAP
jgi:hypothetical protein